MLRMIVGSRLELFEFSDCDLDGFEGIRESGLFDVSRAGIQTRRFRVLSVKTFVNKIRACLERLYDLPTYMYNMYINKFSFQSIFNPQSRMKGSIRLDRYS